jgi:hypothetical protein
MSVTPDEYYGKVSVYNIFPNTFHNHLSYYTYLFMNFLFYLSGSDDYNFHSCQTVVPVLVRLLAHAIIIIIASAVHLLLIIHI